MVPQFLLTKMGVGPADLDGELPLLGVAVRWLPGPNRPDYCLARMLSPITDHVPESFDMAPRAAAFASFRRGRRVPAAPAI
jgi:hypothetical protein